MNGPLAQRTGARDGAPCLQLGSACRPARLWGYRDSAGVLHQCCGGAIGGPASLPPGVCVAAFARSATTASRCLSQPHALQPGQRRGAFHSSRWARTARSNEFAQRLRWARACQGTRTTLWRACTRRRTGPTSGAAARGVAAQLCASTEAVNARRACASVADARRVMMQPDVYACDAGRRVCDERTRTRNGMPDTASHSLRSCGSPAAVDSNGGSPWAFWGSATTSGRRQRSARHFFRCHSVG